MNSLNRRDNINYRDYIDTVPNFPKPDVMFWDFAPLLAAPEAFSKAIDDIQRHFLNKKITKIAAIEAKGFTIGAALAQKLHVPLILIRKPGLIPGKVNKASFIKEYGQAEYQIKDGSLNEEDNVLIVYDIMAGSGASMAAIELVESQGAEVQGLSYIVELEYLQGREVLEPQGYDLFSLVKIQEKHEKIN
jgi:adenine phosphoribosyltransferase